MMSCHFPRCSPLAEKYPQLARPPLREALVDIKLRDPLPAEWLKTLEHMSFSGFDSSHTIRQGGFKFMVPPDSGPATAVVESDEMLGLRYDRNDGTRMLQARRNGMTFSILKGYTHWEALRDSTRGMWAKYLEVAGHVHVDRLAVRYINAIEIAPGDDCDDYLTAAPRIPDGLPQVLNNFIQRVAVPFEDEGAVAIVTQTLGPPPEGPAKNSAILDIDVFSQCSLEGSSTEVWLRLDNLRDIANRIFFSSVTKQVLESYQ
jgi:uncharacterized protein (TIGR04255 family)